MSQQKLLFFDDSPRLTEVTAAKLQIRMGMCAFLLPTLKSAEIFHFIVKT
jgi:hypothetical protein